MNNPIPYITEEKFRENEKENKKKAFIVIPDSDEGREILEKITTKEICGECRHFNLRAGQEEIRNTQFIHVLCREMDLSSLGQAHRWDGFGQCEHFDGGKDAMYLVHRFSPGRAPRGYLEGSSVKYTEKDQDLKCPAWESCGAGGKRIRSSRMLKNSRTQGTD